MKDFHVGSIFHEKIHDYKAKNENEGKIVQNTLKVLNWNISAFCVLCVLDSHWLILTQRNNGFMDASHFTQLLRRVRFRYPDI